MTTATSGTAPHQPPTPTNRKNAGRLTRADHEDEHVRRRQRALDRDTHDPAGGERAHTREHGERVRARGVRHVAAAPLYAHELEGRRGEQAEDAEDAERDGALREPPRDGVQDRAVRPVRRALDAVCVCEADLRGRSGGALGEGRTTDHEGDHEDEGGEGVGRDHQLREV
jgi:hypothetical protein